VPDEPELTLEIVTAGLDHIPIKRFPEQGTYIVCVLLPKISPYMLTTRMPLDSGAVPVAALLNAIATDCHKSLSDVWKATVCDPLRAPALYCANVPWEVFPWSIEYPGPTVMFEIVGVNVDESSADSQIKSFAVGGLSVMLRLEEDPLASTTQLVL
jgi:hypothetical protein